MSIKTCERQLLTDEDAALVIPKLWWLFDPLSSSWMVVAGGAPVPDMMDGNAKAVDLPNAM